MAAFSAFIKSSARSVIPARLFLDNYRERHAADAVILALKEAQ